MFWRKKKTKKTEKTEETEIRWPSPEKPYPPAWLAYSKYPHGSMAWRGGPADDYSTTQWEWLRKQSSDAQKAYKAMFPAPPEFSIPFVQVGRHNFWICKWHPEGLPKYNTKWAIDNPRPLLMFYEHFPETPGRVTEICLSQWYPCEFYHGRDLICVEQYLMAQKAALFGDRITGDKILEATDPAEMIRLGRTVSDFDQKLWDELKYTIALNGIWRKFIQNYKLRQYLLSTGDSVLVHAAPDDDIWGIGCGAKDPRAWDPSQWRGQNLLGFALMEARDKLREVCKYEHLCDASKFDA